MNWTPTSSRRAPFAEPLTRVRGAAERLLAGRRGSEGASTRDLTAAAFAGIVADPIQRRMGLHHHRLLRLIDALERQWRAEREETGLRHAVLMWHGCWTSSTC